MFFLAPSLVALSILAWWGQSHVTLFELENMGIALSQTVLAICKFQPSQISFSLSKTVARH